MSNAPKRNKQFKLPQQATPRGLEDIQRDYQSTAAQAGQAQYQIYVWNEDLTRLNDKLKSLNSEAAARQELDKKATPPPTPQTTEVSNESARA
jgi:hypothetical protein